MEKINKRIFILCGALLFVLAVLFVVVQVNRSTNLSVTFFDIGQGDSMLIETPSGHSIVIDGGPDRSVLAKLGRELPFYDHTIDLMILTHPHSDHVAGLVEVLKRYDVKHVLYSGAEYSSPVFSEWNKLIEEKEIKRTTAIQGQVYSFGNVKLEILFPYKNFAGRTFDDVNDSSVVSRLTYQDISFLLTGDAPIDVEEELLEYDDFILDSDVLKVGHHGSRYSSSLKFIQAVSPEYAVIQSKVDNKFGHPHRIIVKRLEGLGIKVLRNDEFGDIELVSDGVEVWYE